MKVHRATQPLTHTVCGLPLANMRQRGDQWATDPKLVTCYYCQPAEAHMDTEQPGEQPMTAGDSERRAPELQIIYQHRCPQSGCTRRGLIVTLDVGTVGHRANPDGWYADPRPLCVDTHVELFMIARVAW